MDKRPYRHIASFGKRQEFIAIGELLRRGFDVYIPVVDDQHIDCVIRRKANSYIDVQIKARSKNCQRFDAGRFAAMHIPEPRKGYFFIFYSEQASTYWIFPSLDLVRLASQNAQGKNKGKYHINLTGDSKAKGGIYPLAKFEGYIDNFDLLWG